MSNDFVLPEISNSIIKVGVFVNETIDVILKLTKKYGIDHVQLHGQEPSRQCEDLKREGLTVIKAFSISDNFDFELLNDYKQPCDYFLFDTKGENYGGNGRSFDWDILKNYDQEVPFFLSGGISLANVEKALSIKDMNIHALDVNSGFEMEPGLKNVSELEELLKLRMSNYELRANV